MFQNCIRSSKILTSTTLKVFSAISHNGCWSEFSESVLTIISDNVKNVILGVTSFEFFKYLMVNTKSDLEREKGLNVSNAATSGNHAEYRHPVPPPQPQEQGSCSDEDDIL